MEASGGGDVMARLPRGAQGGARGPAQVTGKTEQADGRELKG